MVHTGEVFIEFGASHLEKFRALSGLCVSQANLPSWMRFPDYERVGWINDLLTQLWPHAATAAAAKVREELEPALAANKPRWMTDISLHTFTLGDAAPHVAAIKVITRLYAANCCCIVLFDVALSIKVVFYAMMRAP